MEWHCDGASLNGVALCDGASLNGAALCDGTSRNGVAESDTILPGYKVILVCKSMSNTKVSD